MKKKKTIFLICFAALILTSIFLTNIYKNINNTEINKKLSITKLYENVNATELDEENIIKEYQDTFNNTDIIGELSIKDTSLKVPIAQSTDNEYYLNHLLSKEKNGLGSVFLDYRNQLTDRKIIIYGHNSANVYTEFNILENYLDYSFYDNHKDIYLNTIDDTYHYQIFSVYIATSNYSHVNLNFTTEEYLNHLYWLQNSSLYKTDIPLSTEDEIIVLQTCYVQSDNSYIIVVGKKI